VPARSQMVYPDGGEAWCSSTSLSMAMAYWADKTGEKKLDQSVPNVARSTYDHVYEGTGTGRSTRPSSPLLVSRLR
jgi:hypothetical protein